MTQTQTPLAASPETMAALLRQRAFVVFWMSRFLTILAAQAQAVTIAWQVYGVARRTQSVEQSAFALGMIGLAQFLPLFALALVAGDTADRHDRRTIIMVCTSVEIVCVGALAMLGLKGLASFWPIFGLAAVFGAARAFYNPASTALAPMLVPRELLPRAIAWNSLSWQGASILGPAVGGLLCAISPTVSYIVVAALYVVAIGLLGLVRAGTPQGAPHRLARRPDQGGAGLRLAQQDRVRLDLAGPRRRPARRGHRPAAGVRPRRAARGGRGGSASCAPRPRSARRWWPPTSARGRSGARRGCRCSPGWRCSGSRPWSSPCRARWWCR
ncbi:MAG: MFS transporter [Caulobacteraceae bacterium]